MNTQQPMRTQKLMDTQESMSTQEMMDTQESMSTQKVRDTQESISTEELMDTQELMDIQGYMGTQVSMSIQKLMGAQESMGTQELMNTRSNMGTQKSMSTQELMDAQELMGTQEPMDTQEPREAPAPALLMPPGSVPLAAAWVPPPAEDPLCAYTGLHPQHHPCPTDTQPHSTPHAAGPLAQHGCNRAGRELVGGGATDLARNAHISHHSEARGDAFPVVSLSWQHLRRRGCKKKGAFWHLLTCARFGRPRDESTLCLPRLRAIYIPSQQGLAQPKNTPKNKDQK